MITYNFVASLLTDLSRETYSVTFCHSPVIQVVASHHNDERKREPRRIYDGDGDRTAKILLSAFPFGTVVYIGQTAHNEARWCQAGDEEIDFIITTTSEPVESREAEAEAAAAAATNNSYHSHPILDCESHSSFLP